MNEDRYDFANFGLGAELDELSKGKRDAIRALFRQAFAAFHDEGRWSFSLDENDRPILRWIAFGDFWEGGAPVDIELQPVDLIEALKEELSLGRWYRHHPNELAAMLAQWADAISHALVLLAKHVAEHRADD